MLKVLRGSLGLAMIMIAIESHAQNIQVLAQRTNNSTKTATATAAVVNTGIFVTDTNPSSATAQLNNGNLREVLQMTDAGEFPSGLGAQAAAPYADLAQMSNGTVLNGPQAMQGQGNGTAGGTFSPVTTAGADMGQVRLEGHLTVSHTGWLAVDGPLGGTAVVGGFSAQLFPTGGTLNVQIRYFGQNIYLITGVGGVSVSLFTQQPAINNFGVTATINNAVTNFQVGQQRISSTTIHADAELWAPPTGQNLSRTPTLWKETDEGTEQLWQGSGGGGYGGGYGGYGSYGP